MITLIQKYWLLIDALNGYLTTAGFSYSGVLLRAYLYPYGLYCLYCLKKQSFKTFTLFLLIVTPLALSFIRYFVEGYGVNDLISDIQFSVKIGMPFVWLAILIKIEFSLEDKNTAKIILINFIIMFLSIIMGVLGLGFEAYSGQEGEALGSRGLFISGNEVSVCFVMTYALILLVYEKKLRLSYNKWIIFNASALIMAVAGISKTALIGYFLVSIIYYYYYSNHITKIKLITLFLLIILILSPLWYPLFKVGLERWAYFYYLYDDIIAFLLSGREQRVNDFLSHVSHASIITLLMGKGWLADERIFTFENDFLDIVYSTGLFGVFYYLLALTLILKNLVSISTVKKKYITWIVFIAFLISVTTGHLIYSAMASLFMAISIYILLQKN